MPIEQMGRYGPPRSSLLRQQVKSEPANQLDDVLNTTNPRGQGSNQKIGVYEQTTWPWLQSAGVFPFSFLARNAPPRTTHDG